FIYSRFSVFDSVAQFVFVKQNYKFMLNLVKEFLVGLDFSFLITSFWVQWNL
ncbi:hypothetical protein A5844_002733, partial [Enterococcus sp. 10A9_DIV0425]